MDLAELRASTYDELELDSLVADSSDTSAPEMQAKIEAALRGIRPEGEQWAFRRRDPGLPARLILDIAPPSSLLLSARDAWELAHHLASRLEGVRVEPSFRRLGDAHGAAELFRPKEPQPASPEAALEALVGAEAASAYVRDLPDPSLLSELAFHLTIDLDARSARTGVQRAAPPWVATRGTPLEASTRLRRAMRVAHPVLVQVEAAPRAPVLTAPAAQAVEAPLALASTLVDDSTIRISIVLEISVRVEAGDES